MANNDVKVHLLDLDEMKIIVLSYSIWGSQNEETKNKKLLSNANTFHKNAEKYMLYYN